MNETQPIVRALCPEPANYSEAGLAAIGAIADLTKREMDAESLLQCIGDYDVLFVRLQTRVTKELMEAGRGGRLRAVVSPTTGLNHIDLEAAEALGIMVFHLRGQKDFLRTVPSTAEHSWGLLLSLVRQIPAASRSVLEGHWRQERFRGRELHGRSLGIVGCGRLGGIMAHYGRAFGMRVGAYDPYAELVPSYIRRHNTLDDLLETSSVVSIHVPLNDETVGLIGEREIMRLQPGAFLINTSRGEIVDENSLLSALASGHIAGAAVDVIQREHLAETQGSPMIAYAKSHDNLIVTPHIGGATFEAVEKTDLVLVAQYAEWLGYSAFGAGSEDSDAVASTSVE